MQEPTAEPAAPASAVKELSVKAAMTQEDYLVTIKGLLSGREHVAQSDADYIQGGKDICGNIADGATMTSFMEQTDQIGGDRAFYRAVVRVSVYTFCPDSASILNR